MAIFQLQCAIFVNLLIKYRSGLKAEIGIFFPMLILRILENVLQPSFLQKMTVLNLLEKISQDPQLIIDVFVNYDCDVDSPNIFERIVNGLSKTALGPPTGSATTLTPAQDHTFRIESVKCLVRIIVSMGTWMDQQLKIGFSSHSRKASDSSDISFDSISIITGEDGPIIDYDEVNSDVSDAMTLEQRRAYKLELQVLFIDFHLNQIHCKINCFYRRRTILLQRSANTIWVLCLYYEDSDLWHLNFVGFNAERSHFVQQKTSKGYRVSYSNQENWRFTRRSRIVP